MRLRRSAPVVFLLLTTSCRSLDGLTGGEPANDAGNDQALDSPADVVTQPCEVTPGTATVCVNVSLDPQGLSPGYGAFSGAGTVGVDGQGFVQVLLFDKDPTEPANGHVLPKVTLRHPPAAGTKTSVDNLPAELVGTAADGTYWVYALFEDNETDARGTGLLSTLPGDFVTRMDLNNGETLYPKVTLVSDTVQKLDIPLIPLRKLLVNATAAGNLVNAAKTNSSIHGDGPAIVMVYDGNLAAGAPEVKDFGKINCVNLDLQNPVGPANVSVWVDLESYGTHNVYSNLYDYSNPPLAGQQPPGTLASNAMAPPQVTIDPTQWSSSVDIAYDTVMNPLTPGTNDPLHCN